MFECVSVLSQYSDFLCNCESGNLSKNCTCPHGYNMENGECSQEINACDNEPCMNGGGLCINLDNDFECWCLPGYSGKHCNVLPDGTVNKVG